MVTTNKMQKMLVDKFFRYLAVESQSKADSDSVPSSKGQWKMAELLAGELRKLGLENVAINDFAVVQGLLPAANLDKLPKNSKKVLDKIGWVCHMDTVDVGLSPDINPLLVENYQGQEFFVEDEKDPYLSPKDHPELLSYLGQDIIISDGKSVLGADNKAAIANIMTALEIIIREKRPHGDIYIAFVPDEEIGLRGARKINFDAFPVDYAYTIDCCSLGEVVYETFNAGSVKVNIRGRSAHPMSAKNILINPINVAHDFLALLDRAQQPEHTEGREGYIWATDIVANPVRAELIMNIRDHDRKKYQDKKSYLMMAADLIRKKYTGAVFDIKIEDNYSNILDAVDEKNRSCIDLLYKALESLNIKAKTIPMRGGTDGSYLSTRGILTPNYFTGAYNFHSSAEFLPINDFEKSCLTTLKIIELSLEENS